MFNKVGVCPVAVKWTVWILAVPLLALGCNTNQFLSFDGSRCFNLTRSFGRHLAASMDLDKYCPNRMDVAILETPEVYENARQHIQAILESEHHTLSNGTFLTTHIFTDLKRDTNGFAGHFMWRRTFPLAYSRWLPKATRGNSRSGNCVVWTFKANPNGSSNGTDAILHGWEEIGCADAISGRVLCQEDLIDRGLARDGMTLTPIHPANQLMNVAGLSRGRFTTLARNDARGHLVFSEYLPTLKFLCNHVVEDCQQYDILFFIRVPDENLSVKLGNFMPGIPVEEALAIDYSPVMFRCGDRLVPYTNVCDLKEDCERGEDEARCGLFTPSAELTYLCVDINDLPCPSKKCFPSDAMCDLYRDCSDSDDFQGEESDCTCRHFKCGSDRCIPQPYGQDNCIDFNEDPYLKAHISKYEDKPCSLLCNRTQCVSRWMIGNGVIDCHGPEGHIDETWGRLEEYHCGSQDDNGIDIPGGWSPKCVLLRDRFDQIIGCRSMRHLEGCGAFVCPEGYVKCPGSYCIPSYAMWDMKTDCPNGEDESTSTYLSIPTELLCDGIQHCADDSDEMECHVTCREGFLCLGDGVIRLNFDLTQTLTDLSFIDHRVRFLNLTGVMVPDFFEIYPVKHMAKLLYLHLAHCKIASIDLRPGADWHDFSTVVDLNLSGNLLRTINESNALVNMEYLETLNLSRNTFLENIHPKAFSLPLRDYRNHLEVIDLSWCGLTSLHPELFLRQTRLKVVNLRGTRLVSFGMVFHSTQKFPVPFIKSLDLRIPSLRSINTTTFLNLENLENIQMSSYRFCCRQILGPVIPTDACHAPTDAISSCYDLMREPALRVLLWVVGVSAVVGNLVVIVYRFAVVKEWKTSFPVFVSNLSLSDILMGVYLLIIASMDSKFRGQYIFHEEKWRSSVGCQIAGFLSTLSSETSAILIFLITLDRFLAIRFPFGQCVGFVLAVIPLLPPFQHWAVYSTNGMCLGLPLSVDRAPGWQYSVTVFVAFNFLLFLLIAFGQVVLYRSLSSAKSENLVSSAAMEQSRRKQEIAIAKRLSLIVISDFLCWFPIGVMGLMTLSGHDIGNEAYAWSAAVVLPINSALNPALYTLGALKQKWAHWRERKSQRHMPSFATRVSVVNAQD